MERIKEAIEKAKASKGARAEKPAAAKKPATEATTAPGDTTAPAAPGAQTDGANVDKITYRQTRVIQLDPLHLEEHRIISYSMNDVRSMSFDILRTQVLRKMQENNWRTMAITSPTPQCGKSVVALNLSMSIARQTEQTVLLADFDLRNPTIAKYLGLPAGVSLINFLEGEVELAEVFVNPGIPRLTILPNHAPIFNATETLTTSKMKALVTDIRDRYESRMIIFDLPPVLTTDDAMAFMPQVDCVLLVVANGASTTSDVKQATSLLKVTNLIGTVLNKAEGSNQSYY